MTTVAWVHDGPVCVEIIDEPVTPTPGGICRCGGCRGLIEPDSAVDFI